MKSWLTHFGMKYICLQAKPKSEMRIFNRLIDISIISKYNTRCRYLDIIYLNKII